MQRWQQCCLQKLENKFYLMNSWMIQVVSRQNVLKKKVSVGHLFVNLAEDGKMQEKIDEPKKELCGFPAFRGDPEG